MKVIHGFGKRFSHFRNQKFPTHDYGGFAKINNTIWVGSPYKSSLDVYDLEGRFLSELKGGVDGLSLEYCETINDRRGFDSLTSTKHANFMLQQCGDLVFNFYSSANPSGQRRAPVTVFDIWGNLVKQNLSGADKLLFGSIKGSDGVHLFAPLDPYFFNPQALQAQLSESEFASLVANGYRPEERDPEKEHMWIFMIAPIKEE